MDRPAPAVQNEETREYLRFHRRRFDFLVATVARSLSRSAPAGGARLLDVGPGFQTVLLHERFPALPIDTAGFPFAAAIALGCTHIPVDLNCPGNYPTLPRYKVIVIAEVIEHLHVPPRLVLRWLASALAPGGEIVLQTPNAASVPKRLNLLAGRNPFPRIPEHNDFSHHFREYTAQELGAEGEAAGLLVRDLAVLNYFEHAGWRNRAWLLAARALPSSLRDGITVTYAKPL